MNILLTSAGRRTYLVQYFKDALTNNEKVYASNSIMTYTLKQADGYVISPNIYDDNYITFLIDYCKEKNISVIISLFDIDLPILAKNKDLFLNAGIKVIVSDYDVTDICNDKWKTFLFLNKVGILQTPTFISLDKAKKALKTKAISYPLFLKPRWGMASIGIYKADNDSELDVLYNKLHKEIFDTYLKYESAIDRHNCIIIQQAISGQEYGIEILNDLNANYVTTMAKKKIAMRSGETDIAEIVDSKPFEKISHTISHNLKHIANLDVDCFITEKGEIIILEMNCRFGGQYPFSHIAGANTPKQIIEWIKGMPTDMSLLSPKVGIEACKDISPVIL